MPVAPVECAAAASPGSGGTGGVGEGGAARQALRWPVFVAEGCWERLRERHLRSGWLQPWRWPRFTQLWRPGQVGGEGGAGCLGDIEGTRHGRAGGGGGGGVAGGDRARLHVCWTPCGWFGRRACGHTQLTVAAHAAMLPFSAGGSDERCRAEMQ